MLFGCALLFGCVAAGVPDTVPTLSVKEFSKSPESYCGAVLRICGDRLANIGVDEPSWTLSTPQAFGYHPARVTVLPCGGTRPTPKTNVCIVGRIARQDGSLDPIPPSQIFVRSPGATNPWYLHAQCAVST